MLSTFNVLEVAGCLFSSQRPLAATSCPLARLQASGIICKAGTCLLQAERPRLPFLSCGRAVIPCAQNRPSVSLGSITAVQGASDGRQQHCPGVSAGEDGVTRGWWQGRGQGGCAGNGQCQLQLAALAGSGQVTRRWVVLFG